MPSPRRPPVADEMAKDPPLTSTSKNEEDSETQQEAAIVRDLEQSLSNLLRVPLSGMPPQSANDSASRQFPASSHPIASDADFPEQPTWLRPTTDSSVFGQGKWKRPSYGVELTSRNRIASNELSHEQQMSGRPPTDSSVSGHQTSNQLSLPSSDNRLSYADYLKQQTASDSPSGHFPPSSNPIATNAYLPEQHTLEVQPTDSSVSGQVTSNQLSLPSLDNSLSCYADYSKQHTGRPPQSASDSVSGHFSPSSNPIATNAYLPEQHTLEVQPTDSNVSGQRMSSLLSHDFPPSESFQFCADDFPGLLPPGSSAPQKRAKAAAAAANVCNPPTSNKELKNEVGQLLSNGDRDRTMDPDAVAQFSRLSETGFVPPGDAVQLYRLAVQYQCPVLKRICVKILKSRVSMQNVCDVLKLWTLDRDTHLLWSALKFVIKNYREVLGSEQWERLSLEHVDIVGDALTWLGKEGYVIKNPDQEGRNHKRFRKI